jgi:hypothetical protein
MDGCLGAILILAIDWGITVFLLWILWGLVGLVGLFCTLPAFTIGIGSAVWLVIKILKMIF